MKFSIESVFFTNRGLLQTVKQNILYNLGVHTLDGNMLVGRVFRKYALISFIWVKGANDYISLFN